MAGQSIGPAIQVLAASQAELANAMKRNEKKTMTLIDNRGVGKIPIKDDGRTPYQKLSGRKWNRPLVRFGERIFFRPLDARKVDDGATGERKSGDLGRRVMSGYYRGNACEKCRRAGHDNPRSGQRKYGAYETGDRMMGSF